MSFEIEADAGCRRKMHFDISSDDFNAEKDKVTASFIKEKEIRGFRKGKAPKERIIAAFGDQIQNLAVNRVCVDAFERAVSERKIKVADFICFSDLDMTGGGIKVTAEYDVVPEFDIPKYEGIPVDDVVTEVSDENVNEEFRSYRLRFSKMRDFEDGDKAADDDMVCISYTAQSNGRPLEEVVPDAGVYAKRDLSWVTVGSKYYAIPGLAENLRGVGICDEVKIETVFPEDFHKESLRGVKAEYSCRVLRASKLAVPAEDDPEVLKAAKVSSADELRARIREALENSAKEMDVERHRSQIFEYLSKSVSMDLPESMLEKRTSETLSRILEQELSHGKSKEELESARDEMTKRAREIAAGQMRFEYLMAEIAAKEEMSVSDEEFRSFIVSYAASSMMNLADLKRFMKKRSSFDLMRRMALESKVMNMLLEKAAKTSGFGK